MYCSKKLLSFRKKNKKFKFSSFPTISGTGPNGAIIHYKASKRSNRVLRKGDVYLVDSGGQYEFGTTDVTRTISLKNSDKRIKSLRMASMVIAIERIAASYVSLGIWLGSEFLNNNLWRFFFDKILTIKYINFVGMVTL